MAFGVSGFYYGRNNEKVEFEGPLDEMATQIQRLPDQATIVLRIYAHGEPGGIGGYSAATLARLLERKMAMGGIVYLLGCSTAAPEGHWWNPVGGLGLLARMAMYKPFDGPGLDWTENLAGQLSSMLSNVYVTGLSGISFPLSRMLGAREPGHRPHGLMADRHTYLNGKRLRWRA